MMVADVLASWREQAVSICNAPLSEADLADVSSTHPVRQMHDKWSGFKEAYPESCPPRDLVTPGTLGSILRWLIVFERREEGPSTRYFVRLAGTSALCLTQENVEKRYLDEFTNEDCYASRFEAMETAFDKKSPVFALVDCQGDPDCEYREDVLAGFFPFCTGDRPSQVIACMGPQNLKSLALLSRL